LIFGAAWETASRRRRTYVTFPAGAVPSRKPRKRPWRDCGVKMPELIVVGSGFSGAVFAREMAGYGKEVLVIEKRPHVGGNMYEEQRGNGVRVHKYGPHIFHTGSLDVWNYIKQYSEWVDYNHCVVGKIDGTYIPIPFNFSSIDMSFDEQKANELKQLLTGLFGENKRVSIFELLHSDTALIKELGNYVLEKIFLHYTAKQWGIPAEQIDAETINRLPVVIGYDNRYFQDPIQAMPKEGYNTLFHNLLDHKNIKIVLNTNAKDTIKLDLRIKKIKFDGRVFKGILFFTGAVDEFLDYQFGPLHYRSLNLVFEDLDCENFQDFPVVNYPCSEKWTRITEFKHFPPGVGEENKEKTTILKEIPLEFKAGQNEPFYPVINGKTNLVYEKYADRLRRFDGIVLCGRLAEFKYYNMDAAIERALFFSERIRSDMAGRHAVITKLNKLTSKFPVIRQIFLYGIIGSFSAGIDASLFFILSKMAVNLYGANFISINCAICISFLLNSFVNFKMTKKLLNRALKFFIVCYFGLLFSMIILYAGVNILRRQAIAVKIFSVFFVASIQFCFNKFFTFGKEKRYV
jgi:UDP-galactopyranose mutase